MSANKHEILTGAEPYRDPYQKAFCYDQKTEQYSDAQSEIYNELDIDTDVSRMDQFHVLQLLNDGKPEESYNYLEEQVLEE